MGAKGLYTIVGALPRGSANHTVLALREDGNERQGLVLRPAVADAEQVVPPRLPGLVPLLGFDEVDGAQYALYEFSPGVTLREIIEAFRTTQRRAPLGLAGRIVVDAARVISALHTGPKMMHGALHDGALLVSFDGICRLIDVGSGRRTRFEAPEIDKGESPSPRSDIYALAAMMHSAATGFTGRYAEVAVRAPTSADLPPPSKHHADAPPELDQCLFRALVTNPAARIASARQFADELEKALAGKIYGRDQVAEALTDLFGDRVAAIKSLISRAIQDTEPPRPRPSRPKQAELPTGPRPSGPKPRPSAPRAPPVEMVPGTNIPAGTQPAVDLNLPEQQVVFVEAEEDSHLTRPERPRPSTPKAPKRVSKPNNPVVQRPGPPVPSEQALPPVAIEDDSPATGVEQAYVPSQPQRHDRTDQGPSLVVQAEAESDSGAVSVNLDGDGGALGAEEDNPTAIRPRARPSAPRAGLELKQQTEEEKAAAAGQEKIETGDIDPENLGELASLQDNPPDVEQESTNVKARPKPPPGRVALDAPEGPDESEGTVTKKPKGQKKKGGFFGKFVLFLLLVGAAGAGAAWKFRPWRGRPLPPIPAGAPPQVQAALDKAVAFLVADGALPPGGAMQVVQLTDDQIGAPTPEDQLVAAAQPPEVAAQPAAAGTSTDAGEEEEEEDEADDGGHMLDAGHIGDGGAKAPATKTKKKKKKKR